MKFLVLFIFLLYSVTVFCRDNKILKISYAELATKTYSSTLNPTKKLIKTAYNNIGHQVEFVGLPPERAIIRSNAGEYDAELLRAEVIEKHFKNLVRVDIPLQKFIMYIYCQEGLKFDDIGDLKNYSFAYKNGAQLSKMFAKKSKNFVTVNSFSSLISIFEKKRVDCINIPKFDKKGFSNFKPFEFKAFHYIHKKNKDLAPRLEAEIEKLLKS